MTEDHPELARERAALARRLADQLLNGDDRRRLLEIAEEFDRKANQVVKETLVNSDA